MTGMNGVSAYQQMNQNWKTSNNKTSNNKTSQAVAKNETASSSKNSKEPENVKTTNWEPLDKKSSLVPTGKEGYGTVIGDVQLSEKAQQYYGKLKSKFANNEFILVSRDMKSQVQANASAYGNANKMVVLIDEDKLEQMANDESYRKKYEGIITMSQSQLAAAKNSFASTGANVKNFGMSVSSDGKSEFFATVEKNSTDLNERLEKKQKEKKAAKAKEKKQAEKKARQERLEKARAEKKAEEKESIEEAEEKEYITFKSDSAESLIDKVAKYASENRTNSVLTEEEQKVGQKFDYKG